MSCLLCMSLQLAMLLLPVDEGRISIILARADSPCLLLCVSLVCLLLQLAGVHLMEAASASSLRFLLILALAVCVSSAAGTVSA
jgi:hypothetical protein